MKYAPSVACQTVTGWRQLEFLLANSRSPPGFGGPFLESLFAQLLLNVSASKWDPNRSETSSNNRDFVGVGAWFFLLRF